MNEFWAFVFIIGFIIIASMEGRSSWKSNH